MIAKKCDCCGVEFNARNCRQHYCSEECQKAHYRQTNRASVMKELKKQQQKNLKSVSGSIAEIVTEARKHGMSYGKYLAMVAARGK